MEKRQLPEATAAKIDEIEAEDDPYRAVTGFIELLADDEYSWDGRVNFTAELQLDGYRPQVDLSDEVEEQLRDELDGGSACIDTEYGTYEVAHERRSQTGPVSPTSSPLNHYLVFEKLK